MLLLHRSAGSDLGFRIAKLRWPGTWFGQRLPLFGRHTRRTNHQRHQKTSSNVGLVLWFARWIMRWRDGPPSVWWKQCCNSLFASFRLRVNRSNMLQLNFYFVKLDVSGRFWHIHVPSCTYFMLMILLGKKKWSAGWSTCRNSPDLIESLLGRLNDFVEGKEVRLGNLDLICVSHD